MTSCEGRIKCALQIVPHFPHARTAFVKYHASPKGRSVTGFVAMCAGGVLLEISQRQHLVTPEPTSSETVAAGTCVNYGIPINNVFQEISVRFGEPTPFWLDSQSTLLMATSDTSVKRSAWISRRVEVIAEAVQLHEIAPHKCGDPDMLAEISAGLGDAMPGIEANKINEKDQLQTRGW